RPWEAPRSRFSLRAPLPRSYTNYLGRKLFLFLITVQGIGAFSLITAGVFITKWRTARSIIFPVILHELSRSGVRLLTMFLFFAVALGLGVIGETISWLTRV